jgi:flagellar hook-basal body complex protein FliE
MISGISPLGKIGSGNFLESPATGASGIGAMDFGASLANAIGNAAGNVVSKMELADGLSIKALQGGDVSTREVVDAVMSAEQALQTSIAIRDKIVTAYLEISRMAI